MKRKLIFLSGALALAIPVVLAVAFSEADKPNKKDVAGTMAKSTYVPKVGESGEYLMGNMVTSGHIARIDFWGGLVSCIYSNQSSENLRYEDFVVCKGYSADGMPIVEKE